MVKALASAARNSQAIRLKKKTNPKNNKEPKSQHMKNWDIPVTETLCYLIASRKILSFI